MPKSAEMRQRRNEVSTAATLPADGEAPQRAIPALPTRPDEEGEPREWNEMTIAWWEDLWCSPMAVQFIRADLHGLYLLAELMDGFWETPSMAMAAEIRHQGERYGLSPLDRRRLEWKIPRPVGQEKTQRRPRARKSDPRQLLRAVK